MSVSKRTRFEVFKRDKFTCQYCGKRPPDVMLEADHVHPVCEGGTDDPSNLTTACMSCNRGKAGIPLGDVAPAIDEEELYAGIQEMLERSHALREQTAAADHHRRAVDQAVGKFHRWRIESFGNDKSIEDPSVRKFLDLLGPTGVADAISATESAESRRGYMTDYRRWRYFCGVCWTMIKAASEGES